MPFSTFKKMCVEMIEEFDAIPTLDIKKPRVGVVGEILVKFSPTANNHLVELLEAEGAEAVVPDLMDFMFYCFYNQLYKADNLGTSKKSAKISKMGIKIIEHLRKPAAEAFAKSKHFIPPADIEETARNASEIVSIGNQTGEGWFLTGEMLELIHSGVNNIVCTQPFGCLPNHVVGRGISKKLKEMYPNAQILPLDYDPDVSFANIENRLQMLVMNAKQEILEENEERDRRRSHHYMERDKKTYRRKKYGVEKTSGV